MTTLNEDQDQDQDRLCSVVRGDFFIALGFNEIYQKKISRFL